MYTEQEKDEIILEYFGTPGSEGAAQCPRCSEALQFKTSVIPYFGLQVTVRCPVCEISFDWSQPQPERPWKELHLSYFVERYTMGEVLRCPFDDSYVTYAEFSDSVLQFNCPYCNRRGKVKLGSTDDS